MISICEMMLRPFKPSKISIANKKPASVNPLNKNASDKKIAVAQQNANRTIAKLSGEELRKIGYKKK